MRTSFFAKLKNSFREASQWLRRTPERALDEAYEAAQRIRAIEENHFNGGRISPEYGNYGASVNAYFQSELRKYLRIARVRMAEFNASRSMLQPTARPVTEIQMDVPDTNAYNISVLDNSSAVVLRKLRFIDEVLGRYSGDRPPTSAVVVVDSAQRNGSSGQRNGSRSTLQPASQEAGLTEEMVERTRKSVQADLESYADKTGVLPRSILRTVDRIKRELDPNAEAEVVENFRTSKVRTVISLRLILLLILLPLLTQQIAKGFIIGPIVDHLRNPDSLVRAEPFLNVDMEDETYAELQRYEERIRFEVLIGKTPALTEEQMQERLQERAIELEREAFIASNNAIKNVFSDILSAGVFALVLLNSRRDLAILRSFIDEMIYGLSDSAKAFIIILFTDMFVGFHSPHGWEVLLEGVARHFGLAANRDFIFLFIATFPVILDTIFKYWIFRYLNRISPSAVATYRNMNE